MSKLFISNNYDYSQIFYLSFIDIFRYHGKEYCQGINRSLSDIVNSNQNNVY